MPENKKYELLDSDTVRSWDGRTLKRIRALVAIAAIGVQVGDLGGYVEAEKNLQVYGNAWVYGNARVSGNAQVYGDAQVSGNARVSGDARVYGNARVSGNAWVYGDARVSGDAQVSLSLHLGWFSHVGSEMGTLTWFRDKEGIQVKRGCFSGTLDEFEAAVTKTHGDNQNGKEYRCLIEFIRLRTAAFSWDDVKGEEA